MLQMGMIFSSDIFYFTALVRWTLKLSRYKQISGQDMCSLSCSRKAINFSELMDPSWIAQDTSPFSLSMAAMSARAFMFLDSWLTLRFPFLLNQAFFLIVLKVKTASSRYTIGTPLSRYLFTCEQHSIKSFLQRMSEQSMTFLDDRMNLKRTLLAL